mgnify:CR=1 FL=1|jgi:hypothetical protein|tara:strand:+ start:517 stop:699 length:183 start_codon:yes stop_codon:yes gene_type:complete
MIKDYKGNTIKDCWWKETSYNKYFADGTAKVIQEKFYRLDGTLIKTIKTEIQPLNQLELF